MLSLAELDVEKLQRRKRMWHAGVVDVPYHQPHFQGVITFTAAELKGVPHDVVSGYTKRTEGDSEVYDVTFKTPDIFPVVSLVFQTLRIASQIVARQFKFAENPETRKRAQEAHESRLAINVPLLDKALELRRRIAALL